MLDSPSVASFHTLVTLQSLATRALTETAYPRLQIPLTNTLPNHITASLTSRNITPSHSLAKYHHITYTPHRNIPQDSKSRKKNLTPNNISGRIIATRSKRPAVKRGAHSAMEISFPAERDNLITQHRHPPQAQRSDAAAPQKSLTYLSGVVTRGLRFVAFW